MRNGTNRAMVGEFDDFYIRWFLHSLLAGLRALAEEPDTLGRVRWAARKALERLIE